MFRFIASLLVCTLFSSTIALAQIQHGGVPYSFGKQSISQTVPVVTVKAPNVNALIAEDAMDAGKGIPYRFGEDIDVSFNLQNAGIWETLKTGDKLWRLNIQSVGATSLNFIFDNFYLPEGASLFIYTENKSYVLGAFNASNNKAHGKFSTTVLPGGNVVFEYYEPAAVVGQGLISFSKVIYGYKNTFFKDANNGVGAGRDFGDSGGCNNNVACAVSAGWDNEINASLLYMLGNNTRICSGSMLNNERQDGTPYFLSANHCYSSDWATWIFMFNYQSAQCTPSLDGPTNQTVSGSTLRAKWSTSDFMLFELSSTPPPAYNVYYAGWNNVNSPGTSAVGIHHPASDVKKISFDNNPYVSNGYFGGAGNDHWEIQDWDDGTTEGGSSGSPLFDQNHRVVGQLHGGNAACGNNQEDYYGKFSLSWTGGGSSSSRLRDWLDPDATGATVIDGASFNTPTFSVDVNLQTLDGIELSSCNATVNATVRVANYGSTPITDLTIHYRIDGGAWNNLNYTGTLNFPQSTVFTIPTVTLAAGQHNIEVELVSINNGLTDQNNTNDDLTQTFTIVAGTDVTVNFTSDFFGGDNTLTIYDDTETAVWTESGFADFDPRAYSYSICLGNGCYVFEITDASGNGICCTLGNGSYEVILPGNISAGTGGQFGQNDTVQFCLTGGAIAPVASFSANVTQTCVGQAVEFTDLSLNTPTGWVWSFPGGTPSTSALQNPSVTYNTIGKFAVSLIATNTIGSNTATVTNYIDVTAAPDISLQIIDESSPGANDGSVTVVSNTGATYAYEWSNGAVSASRTGLAAGNYTVSVSVPNGCTLIVKANVGGSVGVDDVFAANNMNVYPIPANQQLFVELTNIELTKMQVSIINLIGQQLYNTTTTENQIAIPVNQLQPGIYLLQVNTDKGSVSRRIVVH